MRKLFIILLILQGCNYKKDNFKRCIYKLDSLLSNSDTSHFVIKTFSDGQTDIIEKENDHGEKGIYTFDKNKTLRFYAFLTNQKNDYYFHVDYDSSGNVIGRSSGETVQIKIRNYNSDSLAITILFFSLHNSYTNISVLADKDSIKNIKLKKSNMLSNIVGNTVLIKKNVKKIYVGGTKINTCGPFTVNFKDSAAVVLPR